MKRSGHRRRIDSTPEEQTAVIEAFEPYRGKMCKSGTGNIYQVNDRLWTGKYSPTGADGKRIRKNSSAHTREECEQKLAKIREESPSTGRIGSAVPRSSVGRAKALRHFASEKQSTGLFFLAHPWSRMVRNR